MAASHGDSGRRSSSHPLASSSSVLAQHASSSSGSTEGCIRRRMRAFCCRTFARRSCKETVAGMARSGRDPEAGTTPERGIPRDISRMREGSGRRVAVAQKARSGRCSGPTISRMCSPREALQASCMGARRCRTCCRSEITLSRASGRRDGSRAHACTTDARKGGMHWRSASSHGSVSRAALRCAPNPREGSTIGDKTFPRG